ncbi:MAG TPA: peptidylprolyl isomerase [Candidatus Acidoferrales bacterium]|nr:peptidylprolyl isomerase [Candidatus Acidoferrales bacterium]
MKSRTLLLSKLIPLALLSLALPAAILAQQKPQTVIPSPPPPAPASAPGPAASTHHGVVAEEIVARVNNDIISLTDYEKAEAALHHDVTEDCQACPADRVDAMYKDKQKDLLRDLIDQQLLVQRGKDEGISVETDVIKRLDDVRRQNNLASLDDLEKAVESEGLSWEEYKTQFRNALLTQEVIHREMGSRIVIGHDEVKRYYDAHQKDFVRPETVDLAEIFLDTQGKTPQEIEAIDQKANDYRNRILKGEEFSEIAKRYSEGSTKDKGGNLGTFERGQLSKQLEDIVFKMDKGQITEVIQTKTGYEILKVLEHFQAGLQPVEKVETEIMNKIYMQKMQPQMREYLAQLREESYVTVKPGFTDSAAVPGASVIQEVAPTADTSQKSKKKMKPKLG